MVDRRDITLFRHPLITLSHALTVFVNFAREWLHWMVTHRAFFGLVPCVAVFAALLNYPGPWSPWAHATWQLMRIVSWWVGLGVLSSVGLGTGMHTGLLFLFPHILRVCVAASECHSMDFSSLNDVWLHDGDDLLVCRSEGADSVVVDFWQVFWRVFWPCMLWGAGTAIGEVPPYLLSRAAALAGQADEEFDELFVKPEHQNAVQRLIWAMKEWMVGFLQNHGFIGVLLMAAYPNALFDLCGICCGHFLMPFWEFFLATFIGKALIKVHMQAAFFIVVFTPSHLEAAVASVDRLFPDRWEPCVWATGQAQSKCHVLLHRFLSGVGKRFHEQAASSDGQSAANDGGASFSLGTVWRLFVFLLIGYFVVGCIEQFARQHQAELDRQAGASAAGPAKRSPGRPRKTAAAADKAPAKRSPGRPRRSPAPVAARRASPSPAKRSPGRPPKRSPGRTRQRSPSPAKRSPVKRSPGRPPKRSPGRPPNQSAVSPAKRSPGRPPKVPQATRSKSPARSIFVDSSPSRTVHTRPAATLASLTRQIAGSPRKLSAATRSKSPARK